MNSPINPTIISTGLPIFRSANCHSRIATTAKRGNIRFVGCPSKTMNVFWTLFGQIAAQNVTERLSAVVQPPIRPRFASMSQWFQTFRMCMGQHD